MTSVQRVVIHLGSDKAGSTAIQESLFANRDWYGNHGLYIPTTGLARAAGHPHFFNALDDVEMVRSLAAEQPEQDTVMLSWEGVHFFDRSRQIALRAVLDEVYPGASLTFLYYVRNQLDLIQSGVLQQVKQQAVPPQAIADLNRPLSEIPQRSQRFLFPPSRYFSQRIEEWRTTFPEARFVVRLYDRERLLHGDILDDLHAVLELYSDDGLRRPSARTNASLSAEAAIVFERISRMVWDDEDRRRLIDVLLSFRDGSANYLHDDVRAAISECYAEDNKRLVAKYPDCAGVEQSRSRPGPDIDQRQIEACQQFLFGQGDHPTLLAGKVAREALAHLNLADGWEIPEDRGAWAIGARSILRFRPRSMHFTGFSDGLDVAINARYPGSRTKTDDVLINGRSLGPMDLTDCSFHVPLSDLDTTYNVEIVLDHSESAPWRNNPDKRAVLIRSLGYSVR